MDKKTTSLDQPSALDGSEIVYLVQNGLDVQSTTQSIADLAGDSTITSSTPTTLAAGLMRSTGSLIDTATGLTVDGEGSLSATGTISATSFSGMTWGMLGGTQGSVGLIGFTNDADYQTGSQVTAFVNSSTSSFLTESQVLTLFNGQGFLTSISGQNLSTANNDAGFITSLIGRGVSELTNDSGYITGVSWDQISGTQSGVNLSGFTNDSGYITGLANNTTPTTTTAGGLIYALGGKTVGNTALTYSNGTLAVGGTAGNGTICAKSSANTATVTIQGSDGSGNFTGNLTSGNTTSLAIATLRALAATDKPAVIKGASSQSANLTEWQTSANVAIASVDSSGRMRAANGTSALPGIAFNDSTGTGLCHVGSGSMWWSCAGVATFAIDTTSGAGRLAVGVGSQPGIIFIPAALGNSSDAGVCRDSTGVVRINSGTPSTLGGLICGSPNANTTGASVRANATQAANLMEWGNATGVTVYSTISENGYFTTRKNTAPADAEIAAGEVALWFDSTNGASKLMIKGKSANGTVVTGSVTLA